MNNDNMLNKILDACTETIDDEMWAEVEELTKDVIPYEAEEVEWKIVIKKNYNKILNNNQTWE